MQCRVPIRGADDWDPPTIEIGVPIDGEQVVFDTNAEAQGHDFFRIGGMDISKDGRWMLYGTDTSGDERYDFRIRSLETGKELPEVFEGIGGACFTPDAQWVFYVKLDDAWRPYAVMRHRVGTPIVDDVEVYREQDERFWVGIGLSFDERNLVIGTGRRYHRSAAAFHRRSGRRIPRVHSARAGRGIRREFQPFRRCRRTR